MGRRVERLFQGIRAHQRRRTVVGIEVSHLVRDIYPCVLGIELLARTLFAEYMSQVFRTYGLVVLWVERWQRLGGHVGLDVVPLPGNLGFLEQKSLLFFHVLSC